MADYTYERLSALDTSFLMMEDENAYMHVASVGIFEAGPLRTEDGGIDFDKIERSTEALLPLVPRYRQKLKWIPFQDHPVWVDDPSFSLHYHLRHTSLPRPGSERQLKRMAARIMSQPLDRAKPLWETWVIEGLEGDRFAIVSKTHHCMIDGVSGVDLAGRMLSNTPNDPHVAERESFIPRPMPTAGKLLVDEFQRRVRLPFEALQAIRGAASPAEADEKDAKSRSSGRAASAVKAVRETLGWTVTRPERTPHNAPIGPHRRFDWISMDLAEIKGIREKLGGSVNDVALATVAGAVRRFLRHRGTDPDRLSFKVMTPVSVRASSEAHRLGNRISMWMVDLPIDESDPRRRLERLSERTSELKASEQAAGADVVMQATEWLPGVLFAQAARAISHALPFNMVVTNVPGPRQPWYLHGAKLLESFGLVPLIGDLGLGVALGSYCGKLHWGFNADWEVVPDLHEFVLAMERSFAELSEAAGTPPAHPGSDATSALPADANDDSSEGES